MFEKLTSRKLWAMVLAVVAAVAGMMTGDLTVPQGIQAITAAVIAYMAAEGIADAGRGMGAR